MLEDVNNVLNTGDVPGLYAPNELEDINSSARKDCQRLGLEPTPINC